MMPDSESEAVWRLRLYSMARVSMTTGSVGPMHEIPDSESDAQVVFNGPG